MNSSFSYKREYRLKRRTDIEAVFKQGKVIRTSTFRAYYIPSTITRLGISVSSRAGNAIFRNSVKRAVREIFRKSRKDFSCNFDIVVVLSKRPKEAATYLSDLKRLFKCLEDIKSFSEK